MEKEEIYEMVIREMTEAALSKRRKELSAEEKTLEEQSLSLSQQLQERMKSMPEEDRDLIEEYIKTTVMRLDHECQYLYVQGAKDCVELLKKLGVL